MAAFELKSEACHDESGIETFGAGNDARSLSRVNEIRRQHSGPKAAATVAAARASSAVLAAVFVMLFGGGLVGVVAATRKAPVLSELDPKPPERAQASAAVQPHGQTQSQRAAAPPLPSAIQDAHIAAGGFVAREPVTPEHAVAYGPADDGPLGPAPRLNPRRFANSEFGVGAAAPGRPHANSSLSAASPAAPNRALSLIALGQTYLAAESDRPPAFYFTQDAPGAAPAPSPIAVAFAGDVDAPPQSVRIALRKGENFVDALKRAGVRAEDRNSAALAFGARHNLRRLRPGQELRLTIATPSRTIFQIVAEGHEPQAHLLALEFAVDSQSRINLRRAADSSFSAEISVITLTTRLASVSGRISGSLYGSAKRIGAPDKVVADLAAVFAYDVDFQREVFGGDEFEAVFEARYDENGRLVDAGDILYGRMKWKGRQKEKGYYRFASAEGGARADYFDWSGESAKRLLMKTPIDGARLSSGFGSRRHPISGYTKQHKGVDFAASRGTPIKAAGDGVVERADRYGGYGNYVRIRHGQGYKTAYGHMSGFAKGVRAGRRVEQGDIIGYVGSTGASTGPHLHYEVLQEGKHVNPQKLKVATGLSLRGGDLAKFKSARDALDALRRASADETALLAREEAGAKQL